MTLKAANPGTYNLTYYASDGLYHSSPVVSPSKVAGLTVVNVTYNSVSLSWAAATQGTNPLAGYYVYRGGVQLVALVGTTYTDLGLSSPVSYTYTVAAYDTGGTIGAASDPMSGTTTFAITTVSLPATSQNQTYTQTLAAQGGIAPLTWSLAAATGTNTWTVSPGGVVSGTPTNAETDTLTVRVTDNAGNVRTQALNVTVNAVVVGALVHGSPFTVTGSGFGTKPLAAPIASDFFTGTLNQWDHVYPNSGNASVIGANPGAAMQIQSAPFNPSTVLTGAPNETISHPSTRGTKLAAGCQLGTGSGPNNGYDLLLGTTFNRPAGAYVLTLRWWHRFDPNWNQSLTSLFKLTGATTAGTANISSAVDVSGVGPNGYWIGPCASFPNGTLATSAIVGGVLTTADAAVATVAAGTSFKYTDNNSKWGFYGSVFGSVSGTAWYLFYNVPTKFQGCAATLSADAGPPTKKSGGTGNLYPQKAGDPRKWTLKTLHLYIDGSNDGTCKAYYFENYDQSTNYYAKADGSDYLIYLPDVNSGTSRFVSIGSFNRSTGTATQWQYMADAFIDAGDGFFYLTDNSSWSASTIREIQPWTAWNNTSVTLTCNGGNLSAGTVYLHYRLAPFTASPSDTAIQTYTLS